MRIDTIFQQSKQPISFEIFPPKGELSFDNARGVVYVLSELKPDFISVTYSAGGGGNTGMTKNIAAMIQDEFSIPSIAHLTCMGMTKGELEEKIAAFKEAGIENVLALRGDSVLGCEPKDFLFAKDLIRPLAEADFCVGSAAYPEGHIGCDSMADNIEHLKQKQDAGASFFVSQLFFDNDYFYRFKEAADKAGITVPITAGIMPFLSKAQISRMVFMCGASLPSPVIKLLARYENDSEALRRAGIEQASRQLVDLRDHGVDGLHIYTMNRPDIARANVTALRS